MAITTTHSRMIGDLDAGSTYLSSGDVGTSAALDVGTAANNVVQLDGTAKLPAVDGSQLTGISTSAPVIVLRDEERVQRKVEHPQQVLGTLVHYRRK